MQNKLAIVAAIVFTALSGSANADLCATGSTEIGGNWFCQPVQAIRYSNVGTAGSYKQIVNMTSDGNCQSAPKRFSGPLSPLNEEVSLHFRGPLRLKQLAAYTPSTSVKKKRRSIPVNSSLHAHQHHQIHRRAKDLAKDKQERQIVTAIIDGQVVSWKNNWSGEAATQTNSAMSQMVTATVDGQVVSWVNNWFGQATSMVGTTPAIARSKTSTIPAVSTSALNPAEPQNLRPNLDILASSEAQDRATKATSLAKGFPASHGADASASHERIGYYHSTSQTVENLVFLGNHGGQGSGVFDNMFGASLSYINQKGTGGAAAPQILADTTIPSDVEVIIMLGEDCSDGSCGYVRPGAVAYHGFDGADKVFLIEFSMPMDGTEGFNADMPAIWMLNAQIPRTLQYGNSECSCWESGCGEFDIAEALSSGSSYLKSTLHTNTPVGDSDYLLRPISGTMKLAIIFDSSEASAHIQVLPEHADFPESLTASEIKRFCTYTAASKVSHFHIS